MGGSEKNEPNKLGNFAGLNNNRKHGWSAPGKAKQSQSCNSPKALPVYHKQERDSSEALDVGVVKAVKATKAAPCSIDAVV